MWDEILQIGSEGEEVTANGVVVKSVFAELLEAMDAPDTAEGEEVRWKVGGSAANCLHQARDAGSFAKPIPVACKAPDENSFFATHNPWSHFFVGTARSDAPREYRSRSVVANSNAASPERGAN